jgi:late competence protein required for DNA uptake (superfamily II DNA/RNA helicase)
MKVDYESVDGVAIKDMAMRGMREMLVAAEKAMFVGKVEELDEPERFIHGKPLTLPKPNWSGSPFAMVKAATDPKHHHYKIILEDARSQLLGLFQEKVETHKRTEELKKTLDKKSEVDDFLSALDLL